jgi:hypothetical protein
MKRLNLLILLVSLTHLNALAQWVEATGEAKIINGNVSQAREDAIQQALSYVTLGSGGSFSSEQHTQNGRLTKDSFTMFQQANVSRIELLNERIADQILTVNLRVDVITATQEQCQTDNLKAAILLPQAQISDRAQLRYGNIGNFQTALSQRLGNIIQQRGKASFPNVHANERLDMTQSLIDIRGYRLPSWLSEITDSQYVLLPEIIDISTEPVQSSMLGLWSSSPMRQFQLRLSLYHGISGEQIWSENYSSPAPWEFEKQATVPSQSNRFWASSYGKNIDAVLTQASTDIDRVLSCRPLLGQIVSKQHNRVIINLGRNHGIKVGDSFQLVLQQNMPDRLDNMRAVAGKSRATVTIDQVTQESATAVLEADNAALNIQINDIAIKI